MMKGGYAMKPTPIISIFALSFTLLITACSGGGGGAPEPAGITLGDVIAHYFQNGENWNDYVKNDGADRLSGTDKACDPAIDGPGYDACIHGGEMRVFEVTGKASCEGVTASDSLNAFEWVCDDSTDPVRFISTGLQNGKLLSDLLDFNTAAWRRNSVIVYSDGSKYGATPASIWWSNLLVEDNDGMTAGETNVEGTVYLVTAIGAASYEFGAIKLALVIKPGVTLSGAGGGSNAISAIGQNFLWVEGNVDATGGTNGIFWDGVGFSVLRNVAVDNANNYGVYLTGSSNNTLAGINALNNGYNGVELMNSSGNTLSNVTAANNGSYGFHLVYSSINTITDVTATNNGSYGVYLTDSSNNNTLTGITAANNGYYGVRLWNISDSNILSGITAANNGSYGVGLWNYSNNNTLTGINASNNRYDGFELVNASNNTFSNVTAANNGSYGVHLFISSNNTFTGLLKVGDNSSPDCTVSGGVDPGLVNGTCANNGDSDAILTTGVTLAASFVAKASSDSANVNGATGVELFDSITDWIAFDNPYRGWGLDGSAFPDADHRGQCAAGQNCRIWDWSLAQGDTGDHGTPTIHNVLAMPTGSDTLTHTWSDKTTITFLRNAVEAMGDGIGNDNTLCESNEVCLYTPNIGSYQGHGSLMAAGFIGAGGTLENISLLKYENNGY